VPAKVEELAKEEEHSSDDTTSLDCQLGKAAEAALGAAGAEGLVVEWHAQEVEPRVEEDLSSAVSKAKDLRTHPRRAGVRLLSRSPMAIFRSSATSPSPHLTRCGDGDRFFGGACARQIGEGNHLGSPGGSLANSIPSI
jgi:hypothetical protein